MLRKYWKVVLISILSISATLYYFAFNAAVNVVSVEGVDKLNPRGGIITIKYTRARDYGIYISKNTLIYDGNGKPSSSLYINSNMSADGKSELLTIVNPTPFNQKYILEQNSISENPWWAMFGFTPPPKRIKIETQYEDVAIDGLIPASHKLTAPESLNNQIVIKFKGGVIGDLEPQVHYDASELEFISMTPVVSGYYLWSNPTTLTFNFTQGRPEFDTTYSFEVFPEKLIDPSYQKWVGLESKISLATSGYDVYVSDVSIVNEATWSQPLRITFSGNMVGVLDINKPKSSSSVPISLMPKVDGVWKWLNAKTIQFKPQSSVGWPVKKEIEVKVLPAINLEADRTWTDHHKLNTFSFFVKPRVQSMTHFSLRGESVDLEEELKVSFSRDIVGSEQVGVPFAYDESISSSPIVIKPEVSGELVWVSKRAVKFSPSNLWSELTKFEVIINPRFNPDPSFEWRGNNAFSFSTVENLIIPEFYFTPEDRLSGSEFYSNSKEYLAEGEAETNSRLWIKFNKKLGKNIPKGLDLSLAVEISPPVNGRFKWLSASLLEFLPDDNWAEDANYKIKLNEKLLYHPEQHYPESQGGVEFHTGKNIVDVVVNGVVLVLKNKTELQKLRIDPDDSLSLSFQKNMNPLVKVGKSYQSKSIESKFKPLTFVPNIDYEFKWETARRLKIKTDGYWKPTTEYKVELSALLLPQKQSLFGAGDRFLLETNRNILKIDDFSPTGTVRVSPHFEVMFNKDVRPLHLSNGDVDEDGLFSVSPPLAGQWKWTSKNSLKMEVDEELPASTRYVVTFHPKRVSDPQFTWHIGVGANGEYPEHSYNFNTEILKVKGATSRFEFLETDLLKQKFYLDVDFSSTVKKSDVSKNFNIWYVKKTEKGPVDVPLIYTLTTSKGSDDKAKSIRVVSEFGDRPAVDRKIFYKINKGIKSIEGNTDMPLEYAGHFLQEKPKYIKFEKLSYVHKDLKYVATIKLNSPVEIDKLKKFLKVYHVSETVVAEGRDEKKKVSKSSNVEQPYLVSIEGSSSNSRSFNYSIESVFIPGEEYIFELSPLLVAADGAFTNDVVALRGDVPALKDSIGFSTKGNVISRNDIKSIGIQSTNIGQFNVKIKQIYSSNVSYYLNNIDGREDIDSVAKTIYQGSFDVNKAHGENMRNKVAVTHLDLSEKFGENPHGLYQIEIKTSRYSSAKRRWFLATDLGLVARKVGNKTIVWVNSLSALKPVSGVKLKLVDKWNQTIASAVSNGSGFAVLSHSADDKSVLLLAEKRADFSFIDLDDQKESLSQYAVGGIESSGEALKAYVYSERGVYRPGDQVHIVAVVRNQDGSFPDENYLKFNIDDPSGKSISSEKALMRENGLFLYDFDIPAESKTGKWNVTIKVNSKKIGFYKFQVEEFVPNKIKVSLTSNEKMPALGENFDFTVKANNLFGPAAAGRRVSGMVSLRPSNFKPKGRSSFSFGHDDYQFQQINTDLLETRLNHIGEHVYTYTLPDGINSPNGLDLHFNATVIDDGGRGVTEYSQVPVQLFKSYVGLKRTNGSRAKITLPVDFKIINVDVLGQDIKFEKQSLAVRVYRNKTITHYRKNERGYYRYVTEKQKLLLVDNERVGVAGKYSFIPEFSGEHFLEVEDVESGQVSRLLFWVVGADQSGLLSTAPEKVELKVLTKNPTIGSHVDIEVRAPFNGRMLVTAEREDVFYHKIIQLNKGHAVVSVPLGEDNFPNFYFSATVFRSVKDGSRSKAIYAKGLTNIDVYDKSRTPKLSIKAPSRISPNSKLAVSVNVADTNGNDMFVTIAAVDQGILDLTKFKTPSMDRFFDTKRRLDVDHYSMYPLVMPFDHEIKAMVSPSGDAPGRSLIKKKRVNPESQNRVKSLALWSGLLKFDEKGDAQVELDVPNFDGALRIMAVAYGDKRFASAEKEVVVRDNLVLKPSLPRFLAVGDTFELPVNVFNYTGIDGDAKIEITSTSHVKVLGPTSYSFNLDNKSETQKRFSFLVKDEIGTAKFTLRATGMGVVTNKIINVPVRDSGNYLSMSGGGEVDEATPAIITMPDTLKPGSEQLAMKIGNNKLLSFSGSLSYLLRYPHGCLEQTTSKLFPLLYFDNLVESSSAIFEKNKGRQYFLREGIKKIERMQLENGYYSYWEGKNSVNSWAFLYASHFMIEAKLSGQKISESAWNNMIYRLNKDTSKVMEASRIYRGDYQISHKLYNLYVLALAGENVLSAANHIHDNYLSDLKLHDKARLAAIYKFLGKTSTAKELVAAIDGFDAYNSDFRESGSTFASSTRDLAILLDALVMVDPKHDDIAAVTDRLISKARNGRWNSTQENAFAFMAIGKALKNNAKLEDGSIIITLGNGKVVTFNKSVELSTADLLAGDVSITAVDGATVNYSWAADGLSNTRVMPNQDANIRIRRRYLDREGNELDPASIVQGQLIVAELRIKSLDDNIENVVVTDLLPTGLEIENSRLSTSADLPWLVSTAKPDHIDMRDDRINLYLTLTEQEVVYFYTTRAVTVGRFVVPSVRAEAMYDEDKFSVSSAGNIRVSEVGQ